MYCTNCGTQMEDSANFCANCGKQVGNASQPGGANQAGRARPNGPSAFQRSVSSEEKRLERPLNNKWLAGVCAAFANFFSIDVTIVRLLWVMACIVFGTGIIAYLVCWIIIPVQEATASRTNYA